MKRTETGNPAFGAGVLLMALAASIALPPSARAANPHVTISQIFPTGYATADTNTCAICRNTLTTADNYQFAAFYGSDRFIYIGRRPLGTTNWQTFQTAISISAAAMGDDHDVVALGVDGNGYMHISWGMHNIPLNLAVSNAPATGSTWDANSVNFVATPLSTGTPTASATYPEFYNVPGSKDLLFVYRNGSSGDGNQYINRYNPTTKTWSVVANPVIQGSNPSANYNAYPNNLTFDSAGKIMMTWVWRETGLVQTNHDINYAQSPDMGVTWQMQNGTPYTLPITENNAQVILPIGQKNSLINTTVMTVDQNDRPLLATWYAPLHAQGNDTRQYMLVYYDGTKWQTSQITNRATEPLQVDATVRDLGRPITLVDDSNRVLVVMRCANALDPSSSATDNLVVAYTTDRKDWSFVTLDTAKMGTYEPTYDPTLWETRNKLDLFYEPVGLGQASAPVSVLEWNEKAFFASLPEPGSIGLLMPMLVSLMRRPGCKKRFQKRS